MEFIVVKVNGKEEERLPVLINNEENGFTGEKIQIEEGFVEISVKESGAIMKEVEVMDTTDEVPMEVLIDVA